MNSQQQFASAFNDFRGQLKSFILRMTASPHDAEDLVQDTFMKASGKLDSFRDESSLKTWVFAIGANLARDYLGSKKRWSEDVLDVCKAAALSNQPFFEEAMQIRHTSPQGDFEIKEHIAFCFTCIGKTLPIEQQLSLLLKEVYQFKFTEIAEILDISEAMAKHHVHKARSRMIDIFDNRCSIINKNGMCHQCSELNGIFNPKQDAAVELNKLQLAREAEKADKEKLFDLRADLVSGIDPFESNAATLQLHHLEHNRQVMEKYLEKD